MVLAITIGSCAFGDKEDVVPAATGDEGQIKYVAGRYNLHACVWALKGSQPVRLMLPEPPGTTFSCARAIAVDNRRVVVTGSYSLGGPYYPIMWINGVPVRFATGGNTLNDTNGDSLVVGDNGRYYITAIINNYGSLLVNGVTMTLPVPPGATQSQALSVSVRDSHVLVGGIVTTAGVDHACYWLDGQCVVLDNTASASAVYDVQLLGNNVYAAGMITSGVTAILWVNGVQTPLSPGVTSTATCLQIYDGMPFIAGHINTGSTYAVLWPGQQVLTPTSVDARANKIYVYSGGMYGGAVMVSGRQNDGGIATAYIWIDAVPVRLDGAGGATDTEAFGMVVGPEVW